MFVEKNDFTILMKTANSEKKITSTKFYEVVISRNLKSIQRVFDAKAALLAGQVVDGETIAMKGMTFEVCR